MLQMLVILLSQYLRLRQLAHQQPLTQSTRVLYLSEYKCFVHNNKQLRTSDNASLWGIELSFLSHNRCYSTASYIQQIRWISCRLLDAHKTVLRCNLQQELLHFLYSQTLHRVQKLHKKHNSKVTVLCNMIHITITTIPLNISSVCKEHFIQSEKMHANMMTTVFNCLDYGTGQLPCKC